MSILSVRHTTESDIAMPTDIIIVSIGYESRSRYLPEYTDGRIGSPKRKVALAFPDRRVMSWHDNAHVLERLGFEINDTGDAREVVSSELRSVLTDPGGASIPLRVLVDTSSMTRERIAGVILGISDASQHATIDVIFCYAPPSSSTDKHVFGTVDICQPVRQEFAGWPLLDAPTIAIVGLGAERGKALGALEYIDPQSTILFRASGEGVDYEKAVDSANSDIWSTIPREGVIPYDISRPYDLYLMLDSLIEGCRGQARAYILPFGPKIFAVCALLVALNHRPHAAVWRVSGGRSDPPVDKAARGPIHSIGVIFGPGAISSRSSPTILP